MKKKHVKLIKEGDFVAEVEIDLIETDDEWSPYVSPADAFKLDDVRQALRKGDVAAASKMAKVYSLTPVSE